MSKRGTSITPESSLYIVSLGPVQSLIEKVRTVRDLWTGSYLLSYLTFQAMLPRGRTLRDVLGADCDVLGPEELSAILGRDLTRMLKHL